jgi:hypothetical protein
MGKGKKNYTETEIMTLSGLSRQTLFNMRNGRKTGKYEYLPKLEDPEHYTIFGRTVMYTEAGKDTILMGVQKNTGSTKPEPLTRTSEKGETDEHQKPC